MNERTNERTNELKDLRLENQLLREALGEYAKRHNWDGAGGWIHPSYGPEFAELALEGGANVAQRWRKIRRIKASKIR